MTVWYVFQRTSLFNNWPLQGDVPVVFHWHFWMPEPGAVLRQVAYSFALCIPLFIVLFLLARLSVANAYLRALAGGFAISGFPLFALGFSGHHFGPQVAWLLLETMAVLACGALYYMRRWPLPGALGVALLLLHFGLWAWATGYHASPLMMIGRYPSWRGFSAIQAGLGVCIMMMYHNGFPVIGFVSALCSGLDIKLLSLRTPDAAAAAS
jgi:hypothetical protein